MKNSTFLAIALLFVVAALWITACGPAATPAAPQAEATPTRPQTIERPVQGERPARETETPAPAVGNAGGQPPELTPPAGARDIVRLAREDLAGRLGLAAGDIRLVSVEAVEWSDTSLGCPQPGMMYAQVITPGFRVMFQAQGRTYEYHTDTGQLVVLCEDGEEPVTVITEGPMSLEPTVPNPGNPDWDEMVTKAKNDLAGRLSIEVSQIGLLEVREVTWPDSSLGCPQPGMIYSQATQDGLLIRLGAGGRMYFYHSGKAQIPFLCEESSQMVPQVTPKVDEFVPPPDSEID
jgi:hypothetical protein